MQSVPFIIFLIKRRKWFSFCLKIPLAPRKFEYRLHIKLPGAWSCLKNLNTRRYSSYSPVLTQSSLFNHSTVAVLTLGSKCSFTANAREICLNKEPRAGQGTHLKMLGLLEVMQDKCWQHVKKRKEKE